MADGDEVVEGSAVEQGGPMPEIDEAVEDYLPSGVDLVLRDPDDAHEVAVVLDAHDVASMVQWAQENALRKWVYQLPDGTMGLTVHAVQDIVQQMNYRHGLGIGLMPETLTVERIVEDLGSVGPEPLWSARVFARDRAGLVLPGVSMEPVYMQLTEKTARKWREKGKQVPEDRRVFDVFSQTKAVNKAYRNALGAFIPEEVEQTVIAMYASDPRRVERIRTEQEQRTVDLPPALTDERAQAQVARARELYAQIRELHGGRGKIVVTPGKFHAWVTAAQHDHGRLDDLIAHLQELLETLPAQLAAQALKEQAVDSAREVACPKCEARPRQFCQGVRGSHAERVAVRLEQLRAGAEEGGAA